jgi:hypothetical protein
VVTGTVNGGDTINYTQQLPPFNSNVGQYPAMDLGDILTIVLFQLMVLTNSKSIAVTVIADGNQSIRG